ncbi:PP2C family protein-serine/threonine phosphatase [Ilumatobacter nonamiensis]|uniref:PP2C family protein-serine/threonine phosphatase n=1 Tax=Ilumatobacter nonamiensis TaxID=467093 RepID=UPI0011D18FF2|nr:GAF domain-containing SpoIIE family protein phosphatase [Ilumatobacter nonamiensis]
MSAVDPVVDPERLAVVAQLGMMDGPHEPVFDEFARLVARLLSAPYAFVTIVDDLRSYWTAAHGVNDGTRSNSVDESFCQYVIRSRDDLVVGDASADPVTKDNPSIETMAVRAWAGAPIVLDGQVIGSFCVVDTQTRTWTDDDRDVLHTFRDQVQREFEHRRDLQIARSAQEEKAQSLAALRAELIPAELPEVTGCDIAGWYRAATDGNDVLGDFYDVFAIDDDRWGVVLGDVCGHGAAAARLTALVRYSLRAAATHSRDLDEVLSEVDNSLQHDHVDPGRFATLSYLTVDTARPGRIERASAGHPPPLVRDPDGTIRRLNGANASPVGLATENRYLSEALTLPPDSIIMLYSDGATDARNPAGEPFGDDALEHLMSTAPTHAADAFIDHIADGIVTHACQNLLDDVALLAIRILAPPRIGPTSPSIGASAPTDRQ